MVTVFVFQTKKKLICLATEFLSVKILESEVNKTPRMDFIFISLRDIPLQEQDFQLDPRCLWHNHYPHTSRRDNREIDLS